MPERITGLSQEILGKTWKSPDAARMWLQRRGTRAEALGAAIEVADVLNGSVRLVPKRADAPVVVAIGNLTGEAKAHADKLLASSSTILPAPGAAMASVSDPLPNALAYSDVDAALDRDADHPVQPVETPTAARTGEAFEKYATEVDDLLQAQNEEAIADVDLRPMYEFLLSAEDAVARIIQKRSAALEAEVEPLGVPGGQAPTPIAPTVPAAVAPSEPQPNPNNGAERQQPAEEDNSGPIGRGERFYREPAPSVHPGALLLQLATPMDPSVASTWGAKLAKWAGCDIMAVDALTGTLAFTLLCKQPKPAPNAPAANSAGRSRGDALPKVLALLDRPGGCVGSEVRDALGWENVPGPYFFRKWAEQARRELISSKDEAGVWSFRLAAVAND